MTITIRLKTGNAAFGEVGSADYDAEVGRLVYIVSERLRFGRGADGIKLHDYNGNTVGSVTVTGK